jgi:tripartite-type tricarboxylate transporter receptor subunit TctC
MTRSIINLRWRGARHCLAALAATLVVAACSSPAAPAPKAAPTSAPAAPTAAKPAEAPKPAAAAKPTEAAKPAAEPAKPAAAAADLTGKTVRIIVGYAPGGGFDTAARILGPYLQEALPGKPTIVIENQPGADSLVAARTVLTGPVRPDEINIVVFISTLLSKSLLAGGIEGFQPENEVAIIGKPDSSPTQLALCAQKKVVGNLDEFLASSRPIKVAATTGGSLYDVLLKWTKEAGFPIDLVSGYAGTAQMALAFNQGEVDATASCRDIDLAQNSDWLEKDLITALFYWAEPPQTLKKLQAEGRFPWFKNVLETKQISADHKLVLENVNANNKGTNVYGMNKQTPAPIVETMRTAMRQAVQSPGFIADMEKRQLTAGYSSSEEIMASVTALNAFSADAKEMMKRLLGV